MMRSSKQKKSRSRKKIISVYLSPAVSHENDGAEISQISNMPIRILTADSSLIGTRDYQQDALFVSKSIYAKRYREAKVYGVLCDGMGGMESGEEISEFVVTEMRKEFETLSYNRNVAAFFIEKIQMLDAMVANKYGACVAGTTMVAVVIFGKRLYWGAVGDSRIYIIRRDEIAQATRDHNYYLNLKEDVEKGNITQEQADNDPRRDALISFIGSGNPELIDANTEPFTLADEDIVLLCSDGLTKSLTDEKILALVSEYSDNLEEAANKLTFCAIDIDLEPKDNTSVILIKYYEEKEGVI